jgi:hypothetical protein
MKLWLFRMIAEMDRRVTRRLNPVMNWYYRLKYQATGAPLRRLEQDLTTPEVIATWVQAHIEYKMDPVYGLLNNIQQPEVTLARGKGDCDDFSFLCLHFLQKAGYPTWLLTLFTQPMEQSHTVCVFAEAGTFHHISNWGLHRVSAPSIVAVAPTIHHTWLAGHLQTSDLKTVEVFSPATIEAAVARMEPLH